MNISPARCWGIAFLALTPAANTAAVPGAQIDHQAVVIARTEGGFRVELAIVGRVGITVRKLKGVAAGNYEFPAPLFRADVIRRPDHRVRCGNGWGDG